MARRVSLVVAAAILSTVASLALMFTPSSTVSSESVVVSSETGAQPVTHHEVRSRTLPEVEGPSVIPVLMIPIAVSLFPLLLLRTRVGAVALWVAVALLWVLCLLGAMSIGMFYLPAAVAMLLAALSQPKRAPRPASTARARFTP